jgi:hypothetical protein
MTTERFNEVSISTDTMTRTGIYQLFKWCLRELVIAGGLQIVQPVHNYSMAGYHSVS